MFQQVEQWFLQNAGGWLLTHPREHTTESGHHRIDTHRLDTLGDSFAALYIKTRGQDCKVLSSWTDSSVADKTTHEVLPQQFAAA